MTWFNWYLLGCLALATFGKPEDRRVWEVLTVAGVLNWLLVLTLDPYVSVWKIPAWGLLELVTVQMLHRYAGGFLGSMQQLSCLIAWLAHNTLTLDVLFNWSLIYDNYENVILGIASLQLLLGSDGFAHMLLTLRKFLENGSGAIHFASACRVLLHVNPSTQVVGRLF